MNLLLRNVHKNAVAGPERLPAGWLALAYAAASLAVLQPLTPRPVQLVVIYGLLVLAPFVIFGALHEEFNFVALLGFVLHTLCVGAVGAVYRSNNFALVFCSLLSAVAFYKLGLRVARQHAQDRLWDWLARGVDTVNIVTILLYAGMLTGYVDGLWLLTRLQKDADLGAYRFALGNAIEIPFVLTAVLYACMTARQDRPYFGSALLNVATSVISESRLIMIIAALVVVQALARSSRSLKIAALATLVAASPFVLQLAAPVLDSIASRYAGQDYGSAADRAFLVEVVSSNVSVSGALLGGGLTSAAELMRQTSGVFRTVESAAMQIAFECGVLGTVLFGMALQLRGWNVVGSSMWRDPIALLMITEFVFFLPIFNLFPVLFFAFGALSAPRARPSMSRLPRLMASQAAPTG